MRLATLRPILDLPRLSFVSLRQEICEEDAKIRQGCPNLVQAGAPFRDFAETAAVIASLDAVISVDTAVAHLAGALGKPLFLLLPLGADFRWLRERQDSPWYPTARLFRQQAFDDWSGPIELLRRELTDDRRRTTDDRWD